MKRVISLLLSVFLLLSLFCVSYAEENKFTELHKRRFEILQGLDIIDFRGMGSYTGAHSESELIKTLSKSAFVNFLCNIYGDYGFNDLYSEQAIEIAERNGIIHKGQDDLNKPLYYDEAVTMAVRMLGYEPYAEENGGFPIGYINVANRVGLTDGINAQLGEALNEYDAVMLLYNLINAPYAEVLFYTEDEVTYGSTSDKTLLDVFRHIYHIKGVVEATWNSALTTAHNIASEGVVIISGQRYATELDLQNYLGMKTEGYVRENKNGNDVLLFAFPDDNEILTLQSEDIYKVSADVRQLTYTTENGSERNVSVSPVVKVVYNGQPIDDYSNTMFKPNNGTVTLISNDDSSEYDVAIIMDYKTIVVDNVSLNNETVRNLYNGGEVISFKEETDDSVKIYSADGEIALNSLQHGDVLSAAISDNGARKVIAAYRSNTQIEGTVTGKRERNGACEITVNGTVYKLSRGYEDEYARGSSKTVEILPGQGYTFFLDYFGEIAYVKNMDNILQYGIPFATAQEGVFNKVCKVKLYTVNGQWEELELADKVEHNGSRVKAENILPQIPQAYTGVANVDLIGYVLNKDGKIRRIDFPEVITGEGSDDTFNAMKNLSYNYVQENNSFDQKIFLKNSSVILCVDKNATNNEDSYSVYAGNAYPGFSNTAISAYNVDTFGLTDMLIMLPDMSFQKGDRMLKTANLFVVQDVIQGLNSQGDVVGILQGATRGYESISLYAPDPSIISGLKRGDIISAAPDAKGNLNSSADLVVHRSFKKGETVYSDPGTSLLNSYGEIVCGKVAAIDTKREMIKIDCGTSAVYIRMPSSTSAIIYDSKQDEVYSTTINEIEVGDIITTKVKWSQSSLHVIYR